MNRLIARPSRLAWTFCLAAVLAATGAARAADGFSAGIDVRPQASAAEIGLPLYPGAQAQRDSGDDSSALSLGLWGGSLGFKLVVMKFASGDSPRDVARYYREALARYGTVLDCSAATAPSASAARGGDGSRLACDDDERRPGSRVYKVGTRRSHRIVAIEPEGAGSRFQLVRIDARTE